MNAVTTRPARPATKDLRKPYPVVAATRQRAKQMRPRVNQLIHTTNQTGTLDLRVTKGTLHRALRIAQSLLAAAERRGYSGADHADPAAITVHGHAYAFKIDEPIDPVPRQLTSAELDRKTRSPWVTIPDYTEVPSGRLRLRLPVTYHRGRQSMWQDGKRQRLEDVLGAVLAEVEQRAVLDEQVRLEREEHERQRQRRAEEQHRAAEVRRLSAHRDQHVRDTVEAWRLARDVRALCAEIATVTSTAAGSADWRTWALDFADRVDPTVRIPQLPDEAPPAQPSWKPSSWR